MKMENPKSYDAALGKLFTEYLLQTGELNLRGLCTITLEDNPLANEPPIKKNGRLYKHKKKLIRIRFNALLVDEVRTANELLSIT